MKKIIETIIHLIISAFFAFTIIVMIGYLAVALWDGLFGGHDNWEYEYLYCSNYGGTITADCDFEWEL